MKRTTLFFLLALTLGASALAQGNEEILIKNATVMTASKGRIEGGSILIRNGKIVAVVKDVKASPNAKVIDATGKYITPGFVDSHSHTALDSINEGSLSVTAMVRMRDVVNDTD